MSQENVEILRSMWEPFKGMDATDIDWDSEAIRELVEQRFSPEVELKWSSGPIRGTTRTTTSCDEPPRREEHVNVT